MKKKVIIMAIAAVFLSTSIFAQGPKQQPGQNFLKNWFKRNLNLRYSIASTLMELDLSIEQNPKRFTSTSLLSKKHLTLLAKLLWNF